MSAVPTGNDTSTGMAVYAPSTEGARAPFHGASVSDFVTRIWEASTTPHGDVSTEAPRSHVSELLSDMEKREDMVSFPAAYLNQNASSHVPQWTDVANLTNRMNTSAGWMWQYFDTTDHTTAVPTGAAFSDQTEASTFQAIDLSPVLTLIPSHNPQADIVLNVGVVSWDVIFKVMVLVIISLVGFVGNVKAIWSVVKVMFTFLFFLLCRTTSHTFLRK